MRVWGLGFSVQDSGLRVWALESSVKSLSFGI